MSVFSSVNVATLPPLQVARVWAIIDGLTSAQREVLARAGEPRWLDTAHPWQPGNASEAAIAGQLASLGMVERVGLVAYHVTHLGEVVAGVLLQWALFGKGGQDG